VNTTELETWTRKQATLSRLSTEYTADVIRGLMNKTMDEVLTPLVAAARSGYWCHTFTRTLGMNNPAVRLPPRSCPAIEQVDISLDGVCWEPLTEALEAEATDWLQGGYTYPQAYVIRSSYIYLLPAATQANVKLRVKVVMRPNTLVEAQTSGQIISFDPTTNILTLNSMPVSKPTNGALTGAVLFDIIEPRGNFELSLCDAVGTVLDSTHVQIAAGYSLARVEAGDYLRCADQSEWPQLPKEFHSIVGSISALPILQQRDMYDRLGSVSDTAGAALQRLREHISPRIRVQQHKPIQHNWR
jgi:hypothetical protein